MTGRAPAPIRSAPPPPDWSRASCRRRDPEWWFPGATERDQLRAKRICGDCPVRDDCAEYAIPQPDLHGIWAGLTRLERKKLRNEGAGDG